MSLPDIKQLRELLKLLRSQGVLQYQSTDLNLVLSEQAPPSSRKLQSEIEAIMEEEEDPQPTIEQIEAYINGNAASSDS